MSERPFVTLRGERYYHDHDVDLLGARRFIVEDNPDVRQLICQSKNERLKPILIDPNSIVLEKIIPIGVDNIHRQRIIIPMRYVTQDGVAHFRREKSFRYSLDRILAQKLHREDYWLLLAFDDLSDFGLLAAIYNQTGVHLTLEDVEITEKSANSFRLDAQIASLGWYGEVYIKRAS